MAPMQFSTHTASREPYSSCENKVANLAPNLKINGRHGLEGFMRVFHKISFYMDGEFVGEWGLKELETIDVEYFGSLGDTDEVKGCPSQALMVCRRLYRPQKIVS